MGRWGGEWTELKMSMDMSLSHTVLAHPLQIFNEQIKDLLIPSGPLSMRDDRGTLVVHGLSLHKVRLCE